jgi:hypothetical protein
MKLKSTLDESGIASDKLRSELFPSFTATVAALIDPADINFNKTLVRFTPMLPYLATRHDTIYTCMLNYIDVLKQSNLDYGAIWCDMGVYHIAKELQILFPENINNIFIGIGGFHMEKNLESILGKYIKSKIMFFADDTMLLSIVKDPTTSAADLNHDLDLISQWAHQWNMEFNPDPTKQATEVLCSCKKARPNHLQLTFNGSAVAKVNDQKYLGLILESGLSFEK